MLRKYSDDWYKARRNWLHEKGLSPWYVMRNDRGEREYVIIEGENGDEKVFLPDDLQGTI